MKIPPTRTHRQLAAWINANRLKDLSGRPVAANVEPTITNTDRQIAGTRLRHVGRGRRGLRLEICQHGDVDRCVYSHTSSETYRKHAEARAWVEKNLRRRKT